jgi:hypothetical protein
MAGENAMRYLTRRWEECRVSVAMQVRRRLIVLLIRFSDLLAIYEQWLFYTVQLRRADDIAA